MLPVSGRCKRPGCMWGSNYALIIPASALNFICLIPVQRLMRQAKIVEKVGLVKGANQTFQIVGPLLLIFFTIIILVDSGQLPAEPWYTIAR